MENTFLITFWEDAGEDYYLELRKVPKRQLGVFEKLQDVVEQMSYAFGNRRVFYIKYNKASRNTEGYFYNSVADYETRPLDEEEEKELKRIIRRFNLRNVFGQVTGKSDNLKRDYEAVKSFYNAIRDILKIQKEFIEKNAERIDRDQYFEDIDEMLVKNRASVGVRDLIKFELQKAFLFSKPP